LAAVLICKSPSVIASEAKQSLSSEPVESNQSSSKPAEAKQPPNVIPAAARSAESRDPAPTKPDANTVIASEAKQSLSPEPAAAKQPPKSKKTPTIPLAKIKKSWPQFIAKASEENHSMQLLLGAVSPAAVSGNTLQIGSTFPYYKDKLNEDKTKLVLEGALEAVFGQKMLVEGVTIEKNEQMMHNDVAERRVSEPEVAAVPPEQVDSASKIAAAFGGEVL